jgi:hypothetical protein
LGDMEGRIIKQSFNLNGGIIIKNVTMRWLYGVKR